MQRHPFPVWNTATATTTTTTQRPRGGGPQKRGRGEDEDEVSGGAPLDVSTRALFGIPGRGGGGGGGDEDSAQMEEPEEEKERFVFKKPRTRELEEDRLGVPGCRSKCFGCVYIGEQRGAAIPQGDLRKLIEMSRQSIGRTDLIVLCEAMGEFYDRFRRKVNASLLPNEKKLPKWPPVMILDHIRYHNQDPEVQQVLLLAETQELRGRAFEACLEESTTTGKVRCNKDQVAVFEKLCKLQLYVQSKDASKMAFYSAGARLDPRVSNQGLISTNTKNLIDYWHETAAEY